MPRWINLPNLLTLLRLALVPFIVAAVLDGRHAAALALFFSATMTDVLDGVAARRLGLATQAGAYLDPIADKCLLSGVYLALAVARIAPIWLVVVIFGRDFYILLGALLTMWLTPARKFPPSVWGKASTFAQSLTAVWSGMHYTWRFWRGRRLSSGTVTDDKNRSSVPPSG